MTRYISLFSFLACHIEKGEQIGYVHRATHYTAKNESDITAWLYSVYAPMIIHRKAYTSSQCVALRVSLWAICGKLNQVLLEEHSAAEEEWTHLTYRTVSYCWDEDRRTHSSHSLLIIRVSSSASFSSSHSVAGILSMCLSCRLFILFNK